MTNPTTLSIAPYRKGGAPVEFELGSVFPVEARIHEIAFADKSRAKDLFADFTRAYVYTSKLHAMCKLHVARATVEARRRRAVILLDLIPGMVKERGLATSRSATGAADIREAFYYTDAEYLQIEDGRAALEAAEALLFGKMMALREAADACKHMLSPDERPRLSNVEVRPNAFGVDTNPRMMESEPWNSAKEFEIDPPPRHTKPPHDEVPPLVDVEGFGTPLYAT